MKSLSVQLLLFRKEISSEINLFQKLLKGETQLIKEKIGDLIDEEIFLSGKHIRPQILLFLGKSFGEITEAHYQGALACEIFHISSLIHDDIIDEAKTRRGKHTYNSKLGNKFALLLGDYIFCHATSLFNQTPLLMPHFPSFNEALRKTCIGEIHQNQNLFNPHLTIENYLQSIEFKTGSLFSQSAKLAAIASQKEEKIQHLLSQYGNLIGIIYQIYDDLNDCLSTEKQSKKTLGTDAKNGKITLPILYLLEKYPSQEKETYFKHLQTLDRNQMRLLLQEEKIEERAKQKMQVLLQQSEKILQQCFPKKDLSSFKQIFQNLL